MFLTAVTEAVPVAAAESRVQVQLLAEGFWRVSARYGFMEEPNIPVLLTLAGCQRLQCKPAETTYFLGRATIVSALKPRIARWRVRIFRRDAAQCDPPPRPTSIFRRTGWSSLGAQVEL